MKICRKCLVEKELSEFWKGQSQCKPCRREYDRERYQTVYKARRRETEQAWYKKQVQLMREIKDNPCVDCEKRFHFAAMTFDHLGDKIKEVANMVGHVSQKRLLDEIAKCELVCANCHAIRTYNRLLDVSR